MEIPLGTIWLDLITLWPAEQMRLLLATVIASPGATPHVHAPAQLSVDPHLLHTMNYVSINYKVVYVHLAAQVRGQDQTNLDAYAYRDRSRPRLGAIRKGAMYHCATLACHGQRVSGLHRTSGTTLKKIPKLPMNLASAHVLKSTWKINIFLKILKCLKFKATF
jgi:hypothetical protein